MRILFVSYDLIAGNLARLLKEEGHEVRLFIDDKGRRKNFENIVEKVGSIQEGVRWVGKDGLIVFDDVGYGKTQDRLRRKGYAVVGGCEEADRLELDREYGQSVFRTYGLNTVELRDFDNLDDAAVHIKANPAPWVIKKNSGSTKFISYVGKLDDGRDTLDLIKVYLNDKTTSGARISLQRRIDGIEIGVGRYFNGSDWVGPIEFTVEHTNFLPGDVGPITSEMGTLTWYSEDGETRLYKETLAKLEPYLRKIGFKGDFELNCIVNETGAYILEATSRFGSPAVHLQSEIHESPWGEFLSALARGEQYDLKWRSGYCVGVCLTVPPFPYMIKTKDTYSRGVNIHFKGLSREDACHLHFEEVSRRMHDAEQLYISDNRGYIMYVTGMGETISKAQETAYAIAEKIVIPKIMYRNDIGSSFRNTGEGLLKKWGYI